MSIISEKPFTVDRIFRLAISISIVIATILLMRYLSTVLIPFAIAVLFAYLTNPLVERIQLIVKKRVLAVILSLLFVIAIFICIGMIVTPIIMNEISHMGTLLSGIAQESHIKQRAMQMLPNDIWKQLETFATTENVQTFFQSKSFTGLLNDASQKALPGLIGLFSKTMSFISGIISIMIILLYLIFLLIDYNKLIDEWKKLIPKGKREFVIDFVEDFTSAMNKYFRAQALIALIIAIVYSIGFSIIGLPLGIILGVGIGILCMIPYLQILGIIPAVILAFMHALDTGQNFGMVLLYVGIVFLVVELLQDIILTPKIMGKVIGMNPAIILLSITIWGKLLGILGLLIALPLTYFLLSYYKRFVIHSDKYTP